MSGDSRGIQAALQLLVGAALLSADRPCSSSMAVGPKDEGNAGQIVPSNAGTRLYHHVLKGPRTW